MMACSTWGPLLLLAFGSTLAGCGGRAEYDTRANAAGAGGAAGAAVTVGAAGTGVSSSVADGGGGDTPLVAAARCRGLAPGSSCAPLNLPLDLHAKTVDALSGVSAEPLQAPDYGLRPSGYVPQYDPGPSAWDRSARPAGACVFRIHGLATDDLAANCMRNGELFAGGCVSDLAPGSFYDTQYCGEGVAPGCPSAEPWFSAPGYWWYLQPDGADVDLVVCAPECAESIVQRGIGACLKLRPDVQ